MARKPKPGRLFEPTAPWDDVLPPLPEEPEAHPRDLYPLDTAGLKGAGPDFARLAMTMIDDPPPPKLVLKGLTTEQKEEAKLDHIAYAKYYARKFEKALKVLYQEALYDPGFTMPVFVKGRTTQATLVSGTTFATAKLDRDERDYGPIKNYDVMVISKYPGLEETQQLLNFIGGSSEALYQAFAELGLADIKRTSSGEGWDKVYNVEINSVGSIGDWYFTNVVRHQSLDPSTTSLAVGWTKNCLPLLEQELRLVLPKFILCFGSEAAKAVLGKKVTVSRLLGRIVTKQIPLHRQGADPKDHKWHAAQVMACVHPAYVKKKPEAYVDLVSGIGAFAQLVRGARTEDVETGLRHVCLYTERALKAVVDEFLADSTGVDVIAVDAEWHGKLPTAPGAYLRTVQFSRKAKEAFCVVLHGEGGRPMFAEGLDAAFAQLARLLKSTPGRTVRVGGHFFRADLPWLMHHGLDLRDEYEVCKTPKGTKPDGRS